MTLLAGCSGLGAIKVELDVSCVVAREIQFKPESKAWIAQANPPPSVHGDLEKVARQNDAIKLHCPQHEIAPEPPS